MNLKTFFADYITFPQTFAGVISDGMRGNSSPICSASDRH